MQSLPEPSPVSVPLWQAPQRVTNYVALKDSNRRRERTRKILEQIRNEDAEAKGTLPRLTVDETTGFLLPRDEIVGEAESNKPPAKAHYPRTVEVLQSLREARLLRLFDNLS